MTNTKVRKRIIHSIILTLFLAIIGAWLILSVPGIPYNFRELFDDNGLFLTTLLLCAFLYCALGLTVLFAALLQLKSRFLSMALPALIIIQCLAGWALLRNTVPIESIHDILGSPILDWPWEWELIGRFVALFGGSAILLTGVNLTLLNLLRSNTNLTTGLLHWSLIATALLPLAHWIVVQQAATDNLTELMARNGDWLSSLFLGLWLCIIAAAGALLSTHLNLKTGQRVIIPTLFLILSIPIAYLSLWLGTEHEVHKYGQTFSALQFLLSPDRSNMIGSAELFIRYAILHGAGVFTIAFIQFPFWLTVIRKGINTPQSLTDRHSLSNDRPA